MIITKKTLSRRTVLRGLGATVALPLLDAMVPPLTALARTPATPARRLGFVYIPNGVSMNPEVNNWKPVGSGRDFEFSPILSPLAPLRDHVTVVSGLAQRQAEAFNDGGGDHSRARCGLPERRPCRAGARGQRAGRDDGGPGCRRHARAGHAAAFARDGGRQRRHGRQLRQRLRLRLPQHHLLENAHDAAPDRAEPGRGLRAPLRRRRHPRRAARGRAQGPQHPR